MAIVGALLLALVGCGPSTASACLEGETGDDEGAAEDGCLFLPGCAEAEETGYDSGAKYDLEWNFDLPSLPDGGIGDPPPPPSPPTWSYHPDTDTFHRLATETERDVHGWAEGTVLVSAGALVDGLIEGSDTPMLLGVPVVIDGPEGALDVEIELVTIQRVRTEHDVWHLESRETGMGTINRALRPELHTYLPTWVNFDALVVPPETDVFAVAYGDNLGGVVIHAMTPAEDMLIAGPTVSVWLESPPPDLRAVLVAEPEPRVAALDDLLGHWVALASVYCANADCSWEPDPDDIASPNCHDCADNDADAAIDGADLGCVHRSDFGCEDFGDHDHRWEDAKDFAVMPDIEWCTRAMEDDIPWHTLLYARASKAAMMLNAVRVAASIHPDYDPPDHVPVVGYRFAYCPFAETIEDAEDCVETGNSCPAGYALGGVTKTIEEGSTSEREYFRRMWDEFDRAMYGLEMEGVRPKPVAMLAGVYSGDLVEPNALVDTLTGLSATIGDIDPHIVTGGLGAMTLEAEFLGWVKMAHEFGHLLGLSHTLPDPHFGEDGFMKPEAPLPAFAILGPSVDFKDGYESSNQWDNWIRRIGDKMIPRPNAFSLTGCADDDDCPTPLRCWNAGPNGLCRNE